MKSLLNKTNFTLQDIQSLISNRAEEGLYLEFKGADAFVAVPGNPAKDEIARKKEIGKDVSAFANADGGLLIYGLKEDANHQADEISWIDSTKYPKGWLQQVIESNTSRPVSALEIHEIPSPQDPTRQVYVVQIQPSSFAPHMTKGGTYHRRNNNGNAEMAEYEVREMYFRTSKTDLEIMDLIPFDLPDLPNLNGIGPRPSIQHTFNLQIKNIGNTIEHHYKLEFHVTSGLLRSAPLNEGIYLHPQRHEDGCSVHFSPNKTPLFQNEVNRIAMFDIEFDRNKYHVYENGKIFLRLYYTNGIKEKEFKLKDLLTHKALPIPRDAL